MCARGGLRTFTPGPEADILAAMTTYSIIVFRAGATPPDVSRGEDLVEGLAKLALARYPGADHAIAVDEMGHTMGEWLASATAG
jgi:hypothetical protein